MNEIMQSLLFFFGGGVLSVLFFGGLWWTLMQLRTTKRPALLMLVSSLLRMTLVVTGMYLCVRVNVTALLLSLAGFVLVRELLTRAIHPSIGGAAIKTSEQEASHAP